VDDDGKKCTANQVKAIESLFAAQGAADEMEMCEGISEFLEKENTITSISSMTVGEASDVIQWLNGENKKR
jgi:hypothetical protein